MVEYQLKCFEYEYIYTKDHHVTKSFVGNFVKDQNQAFVEIVKIVHGYVSRKDSFNVEESPHLINNEPENYQGIWCLFTDCSMVGMNTCLHRMFV